jgi:hypothetical protein
MTITEQMREALAKLLATGGVIAEATDAELQQAIDDPHADQIVQDQAAAVLQARAALAAPALDAGVPYTQWKRGDVLLVVPCARGDYGPFEVGQLVVHGDTDGDSVPFCTTIDGGGRFALLNDQLEFVRSGAAMPTQAERENTANQPEDTQ